MGLLRQLRKAKKITLAELASRVGVSEGQLSKIERGESGASLATAVAIEREIGVPAAELLKKAAA